MSLTGTPFLCTLAVLCALALGLPLVLWSRVRGPRAVRALARVSMLLFAQLTAVALVFTLVNNANQLYDDWGDLLGTAGHVEHAADLGADGTGGIALERLPRVRQTFEPARGPGMRAAGGVRVTRFEGRVSGVRGEVYVWLPPQYDDPAWRGHRFPVVELLPGYPGSAKAWFGTLDAHEQLLPLMRSGRIAPFVLVAPRTTLVPGADTGCANLPGKVNADSWLSVDVPRMVTDNFRVQRAPRGWAVAGYSAGGHCATKLAVAHPDRYGAAVSLSGYNDPAAERTSLTGRDPALRTAHNPLTLLREAVAPPRISLYLSGQRGDGYEDALALGRAAEPPTSVQVVRLPRSAGGHTMALWRPQVVPAFRWLTAELGGQRTVSHPSALTPPGPSSAGARPGAPASGSASPAAAARTR
ncbi:esterase family protein [Streptomyces sp. SBST2-5]|uniref:Esterase family protein n=1 Tax=Streptomyces composti TaxID=2720025 RepID=A0ABX1A8N7_9ACTN|nr:alpha/beta hydrolase-fold protein [Streptomyces composti]NJP51771.1 esterase family protein [Streptomyces composti]